MIYDKARDLAKAMAESEEYVSYRKCEGKGLCERHHQGAAEGIHDAAYPHAGRACTWARRMTRPWKGCKK